MGNIHLNISCGSLKWIIFVESVLTQIERGEVNCMLMFSLFLLFASFMIISGAHVQSWLVGFSYLITHSFYGLLWKLFLQTYPEYTTLAMKQLKKLWVSFIRRFLLPSLLVIRQRDLLKCCISIIELSISLVQSSSCVMDKSFVYWWWGSILIPERLLSVVPSV